VAAVEPTPEGLRDEVLTNAAWLTVLSKRDTYQRKEYKALLEIIHDMPGRRSA
jgi:hypothetical protein